MMNEKINEKIALLALKASDPKTGWLDRQKFAELIVKECAQVCLAQRDPTNLNYKPSEKFAEAVKQHFGLDK
jgi:hypothetical protein